MRQVVIICVAALAVWSGLRFAPPILYDDTAISLRYAERIATGHGFSYNDDERVCGVSNPLWTLIIAAGTRAGLGAERTARVLTLVSYAVAIVVASVVVLRIAGPLPALLVGILLPIDVFWRTQALSALELPLAVALGLGAVLAAGRGRELLAGIFIGLALWNKLDAAGLVAGVTFAWCAVRRQIPRRTLLSAAIVALPWFGFATIYFGSPLPHSLVAKLYQGQQAPFDPLWVARFFQKDYRWLFLVAAAGLPITLRLRGSSENKVMAVALAGWFLSHGFLYSLFSLGDEYPWYLGVPAAVAIVLACASLNWRVPVSAVAAVAIGVASLPQFRETKFRLTADRPPELWEDFDADRRLAGIFLDQFAGENEVVQAASGWVAFESHRIFVDDTGLNSTHRLSADYIVVHGSPWRTGNHPPERPDGYQALATFDLAHRSYPGVSSFTVFGRPSSLIARSGRNETSVDVSRLQNDRLARAWQER
jgi:hypothetical protein